MSSKREFRKQELIKNECEDGSWRRALSDHCYKGHSKRARAAIFNKDMHSSIIDAEQMLSVRRLKRCLALTLR